MAHLQKIRNALLAAFFATAAPLVFAQQTQVEPGLQRAVNWKWSVAPWDNYRWGLDPREVPVLAAQSPSQAPAQPEMPRVHTIKKGDYLVRVAKRYGLTVAQLKEFNGLADDFMKIGQEVRIPDAAERLMLKSTPKPAQKKGEAGAEPSEVLLLRVFLANEGFSTGPIKDTPDETFGRILNLYQTARAGLPDQAAVVGRAREAVPHPIAVYTLKPGDFRFIATPRAEAAPPKGAAGEENKPPPAKPPAPLSYDEMLLEGFLAYRSPWEFVAERFQCDEAFLRKMNPGLGPHPPAGTAFRVPNVPPFAVELVPPRSTQPAADPAVPVTATIQDLSVLEIRRAGELVAAMPVARSRPGLKARGQWKILDALPRPRLQTIQEPRVQRVEQPLPFYRNPNPTPTPRPAVLARPQTLPPGPNNPAGVLWINLARSGESEPLPFGLHGCAFPSTMASREGIGGFRMANWDILRAASLLPEGTILEWKP
jgi:LysM repeat protein/lipoprotein-anchoring transpeptidase ErfK/SrfK